MKFSINLLNLVHLNHSHSKHTDISMQVSMRRVFRILRVVRISLMDSEVQHSVDCYAAWKSEDNTENLLVRGQNEDYVSDLTQAILEKIGSRDHTEIMLKYLGAKITINAKKISLESPNYLEPKDIFIPGDFSSASFI